MVAGWAAVVVLLAWSVLLDDVLLSQWAAVGSAAAASWTVLVGCRRITSKIAGCTVRAIERMLRAEHDRVIEAVADEVVRRMELRELEAQVARLQPSLRRP